MRRSEFEKIVMEVFADLPEFFMQKLQNVDVVVEERPPRGLGLLGLYQGVPLKRRGVFYGNILPDKITLYKSNIERVALQTHTPVKEWISKVLLHEIGHHFGFDEESIRKLI